MKCPWCEEWEGKPEDYLEHLSECPKKPIYIGDHSKRVEEEEEIPGKFVLYLLNEAKKQIDQARGNVKARAFAAAETNIKRAHEKLQSASKEMIME